MQLIHRLLTCFNLTSVCFLNFSYVAYACSSFIQLVQQHSKKSWKNAVISHYTKVNNFGSYGELRQVLFFTENSKSNLRMDISFCCHMLNFCLSCMSRLLIEICINLIPNGFVIWCQPHKNIKNYFTFIVQPNMHLTVNKYTMCNWRFVETKMFFAYTDICFLL